MRRSADPTPLHIPSSPAVRTAGMLGAGGAGFALGNLLLARLLSPAQFGELSLLLSLIQVGGTLAALGLPILVTRRRLKPTGRLLARTLTSSTLLASTFAWVAAQAYDLSIGLATLLASSVVFGALGRVAGAFFQSELKFGRSLVLSQSQNWALLASVPIVMLQTNPLSVAVISTLLASYVLTSCLGWALAWTFPRADDCTVAAGVHANSAESFGAAFHLIAANIFFQIDRLIIGRALEREELALYSVVAAVAGSAFRMLQLGAGYSLTPRLRAAIDRTQALEMLRREAAAVFGLALVAGAGIAIIMPIVFHALLQDRYTQPDGLVAAVVVIGFVRIWQGFAASVVSALGSARLLLTMSVAGWLSLLVCVLSAFGARELGLLMVVYAIGFGWIAYALSSTALAFIALSASLPSKH